MLRRQLRKLRTLKMGKHLVIATRGSKLALWQANHVKSLIEEVSPGTSVSLNVIQTKGDKILDSPLSQVGGKGLFVKEIEEALLDGRADLAVHSMKDVPMELPEELIIGCVPKREEASDCFLSRSYNSLEELPKGALVGTSSLRRKAQILARRPDLLIHDLRGNIDTRLGKLEDGEYDAIILATSGLSRLDLHARHMAPFELDQLLPAVGQGALGIECREDDYNLLVLLASLEDRDSRVRVNAERAFMTALEGGCQIPAGCHARMLDEERIHVQGLVAREDGTEIIRAERTGDASESEKLGAAVAEEILEKGGREILDHILSRSQL